jgi:deoxyribose-phosphate aldolase
MRKELLCVHDHYGLCKVKNCYGFVCAGGIATYSQSLEIYENNESRISVSELLDSLEQT